MSVNSNRPGGTSGFTTPTGQEVLTNKDHDGGTASNTSRFTVPKDVLSNLQALTRKQGTLVFDTGSGTLLVDDGSTLNATGGGSGEKNYAASGTSSAVGWTASAIGITVTTDVIAIDLPRPNTTKTGIKIAGISGSTAYAYYRFILDDADANKKLKIQFDQKPSSGFGTTDQSIRIRSYTDPAYSTGALQLPLSTDTSGLTFITPLTGTFRTTFDAPAITSKYLEIRIGLASVNTSTLVISDVVVGPGVVVQGAAVSGWTSYTPTISGIGGTPTGQWRRIGDSIQVKVAVTAATGTAGNITVTLPNSYTINTTAANLSGAGSTSTVFGVATAALTATPRYWDGTVIYNSGSTVMVVDTIGTSGNFWGNTSVPITWASGSFFTADFTVPVNELTGSGTVNIAQNDVEYAYNSGTWDASDTTSFAYGPTGATITGAITASARSKTVQLQTPISTSDQITLEFDAANNGTWIPAGYAASAAGDPIAPYTSQNTGFYGAMLRPATSTTVIVTFGQYMQASGATFGAAGLTWNTIVNGKWRVKKVRGGQAVGFSSANATSSGLIDTQTQTFSGAKTFVAPLTVTDATDTTRQLKLTAASNNPSAVTTLASTSSGNQTIFLPNAATTLAGLSVAQTWTGIQSNTAQPGGMVYLNATTGGQSLNVLTDVLPSTVDHDNAGNFSGGVFTPPVNGTYLICCTALIVAGTAVTRVQFSLKKAGVGQTIILGDWNGLTVGSGGLFTANGSMLLQLTATTDTISMQVFVSGTAAYTIAGGTTRQTQLTCVKVF